MIFTCRNHELFQILIFYLSPVTAKQFLCLVATLCRHVYSQSCTMFNMICLHHFRNEKYIIVVTQSTFSREKIMVAKKWQLFLCRIILEFKVNLDSNYVWSEFMWYELSCFSESAH